MPNIISIQINPECLDFLNLTKKNISARQNTFIDSINDLHTTVNQLKKQTASEFTLEDEKAIGRGCFYALTKSLEKKFTAQHAITLPDLQSVLNEEFHIKDKETNDFIIKSLLEPHSLPFALATLAYSVRTSNSFWSNECTAPDPEFKYTLKAKTVLSPSGRYIAFNMKLYLKNFDSESEKSPLGIAHIQFMVNQQKQIKLLPLDLEFNFIDKQQLQQFKDELGCDFRDWIFLPKTHWQATDIWIIPILVGCLLGLIAMIGLLAFSLNPLIPILPLLLPPLGLALGLGLASVMQTYILTHIKNEQEKSQRPIHIYNGKLIQTTAFFHHPDKITIIPNECRLPRAIMHTQ